MNTELTEKDRKNLATLVAIHEYKALSYRGACFDKAQARRHEGFAETLKKLQHVVSERLETEKEGV